MEATARPLSTKTHVIPGGFVCRNIHINHIKFNEDTLSHHYHKPYQCDWKDAQTKARKHISLRDNSQKLQLL